MSANSVRPIGPDIRAVFDASGNLIGFQPPSDRDPMYLSGGQLTAAQMQAVQRADWTSQYPEIQALTAEMGLVAFWDFAEEAGFPRVAKAGVFPFQLVDGPGSAVGRTGGGRFSGYYATFDGSADYLRIAESQIGQLNVALSSGQVSVVAWGMRDDSDPSMIAGVWQEDDGDPRRSYGLFVDLPLYGGTNTVCGHISKTGGASPRLPYSRDYAATLGIIELGVEKQWAMTYDGAAIRAYLECRMEARPSYTEPGPPNGEGLTYAKNPYLFSDGINATPADFTVGANRLTSGFSNFFGGKLAGLMVFSRALTPQQIVEVQRLATQSGAAVVMYDFYTGGAENCSARGFRAYGGANAVDLSNVTGPTAAFTLSQLGPRYLARGTSSATGPVAWVDEQAFGIPFSRIKSIMFDLNNAAAADEVRLLVKVSGAWYASASAYSVTGDGRTATNWGTKETKTVPMTVMAAAWRALTLVPGVSLSLGDVLTADLPQTAVLDGIGILSESAALAGAIRIDNIAVVRV